MTKHEVEFIEKDNEKSFNNIRKEMRELSHISFTRIIRKMRLARTDTQAQHILVAIGTVFFMMAIFIMMYFIFGVGKQKKIIYINAPMHKIAVPSASSVKS